MTIYVMTVIHNATFFETPLNALPLLCLSVVGAPTSRPTTLLSCLLNSSSLFESRRNYVVRLVEVCHLMTVHFCYPYFPP